MSTTVEKHGDSQAQLQVVPMTAALGAEIRGVDLSTLDGATFKAIYQLMLEHLVIVFRGQQLVAQDIVNLVRRFGNPVTSSTLHQSKLEERTANQVLSLPPEITVVTNLRENGRAIGILGDGEVVWHSDFSFKDKPTAARMLYAVEIPPLALGGLTRFLNCYAAYDALSDDLKRRIAGKTIKQGNIVDTAMKLRPGASLDDDIRTTPGPSHPIISTHPETRADMLFLGRRHSAYVNGCTLEESEALLDELWAHATQARFCYEHQWAVGDVVIWDNRATLHRRDPFDSNSRRVLYAAQVEGHRPFEAPDAANRPAHPRFAAFHA
jgi:taurine dioxygenase